MSTDIFSVKKRTDVGEGVGGQPFAAFYLLVQPRFFVCYFSNQKACVSAGVVRQRVIDALRFGWSTKRVFQKRISLECYLGDPHAAKRRKERTMTREEQLRQRDFEIECRKEDWRIARADFLAELRHAIHYNGFKLPSPLQEEYEKMHEAFVSWVEVQLPY